MLGGSIFAVDVLEDSDLDRLLHVEVDMKRTTEFDVALGARVRKLRRAANVNQAELARELGLSSQQVQKYESGENRITVATLVRMASALGTSASDLIGEESEGAGPRLSALALEGATELLKAYAAADKEERHALHILADRMIELKCEDGPD